MGGQIGGLISDDYCDISVLILEDHPVVADGLRSYLETDPRIHVVGILIRGTDVLRGVTRYQPKVMLIDIRLDGSQINGIEAARLVRQRHPEIKLLILSAHSTVAEVTEAISVGVDGYILKTSSQNEILDAIHMVHGGKNVYDPQISGVLQLYLNQPQQPTMHFEQPLETLTELEWEVLEHIALGENNTTIAQKLSISEATVKTHINHILGKLDLSREQARVWYWLNRDWRDS